MAIADISQRGNLKTMIRYSIDDGLSLVQANTRSRQSRAIPLMAADLDEIMRVWPTLRETLSNADVQNIGPVTASPSTAKASPGPSNSPSSPGQGSLI